MTAHATLVATSWQLSLNTNEEDFNQDRFKTKLSETLGVPLSSVKLTYETVFSAGIILGGYRRPCIIGREANEKSQHTKPTSLYRHTVLGRRRAQSKRTVACWHATRL